MYLLLMTKVDSSIHKSVINSCYSTSKHMASTKQCHLTWFPATALTWLQVFPDISAFLLYHTPVPPQSSCSMLSLSTLWERNHSSVYVQSTSISAVWYALPRVSLVNSLKVDSHITVHIFLNRHTSVMTIWRVMVHFYK